MAVTNNLLIFAANTTNKMDHSTYEDASQRQGGVQADQFISSSLHNTVVRSITLIQRALISSLGAKSSGTGGTWDTDITEANALSQFNALFDDLNVGGAKTWRTARNFTIKDADSSHSGTAVSVDGSSAVTILLPSTIKATFIGNLTGNVTGGCSGNAGTATKLATARTFYISDSSAAHTGSGVNFDGSGNATLKLPSTITASLIGNVTGNVSGSSGSCTGNAATASTITPFQESMYYQNLNNVYERYNEGDTLSSSLRRSICHFVVQINATGYELFDFGIHGYFYESGGNNIGTGLPICRSYHGTGNNGYEVALTLGSISDQKVRVFYRTAGGTTWTEDTSAIIWIRKMS